MTEARRTAERQAYLMTLGGNLTHTATIAARRRLCGGDAIVDDGDIRHATTREQRTPSAAGWRPRSAVCSGSSARRTSRGTRLTLEYVGRLPGFGSLEELIDAARSCDTKGASDCTRPCTTAGWNSITSRMTLPEAGQHLSLALEAVVGKFGTMVRQVARRYRLDESDVDEVMQEVRIRLWRARETSEQIDQVGSSYIYRTASSAALDVMPARRSRRAEHTTSPSMTRAGARSRWPRPPLMVTSRNPSSEPGSGAIATIPNPGGPPFACIWPATHVRRLPS